MHPLTPMDKEELLSRARAEGLIQNDPDWIRSLEEPMPAWAVLNLVMALLEKLNPPNGSYD
ncbi:hypothetical protein MJA45_16355 [Paenibacillus aurantius]|uniref:Uncharacterized protein n=1 Tax=Paenibacillus aurantius TaxID=2918900 RepID=A0AA96LBF8_9BACL|nr:hypothetical protein [Paenibacillus aurantius]WNQ09215.1 hypothetical protein MJA45_16355 [Paenibacillus aurantius]